MKPGILRWIALPLLVLPPLVGLSLRGFPESFWSFPPLVEEHRQPAGFSLPVFILFALAALLGLVFLVKPGWLGFRPITTETPPPERKPLPRYAKAGFILCMASWTCAWLYPHAPSWLTRYTFFPLWLGFILLVDGLVYHRTGTSRLMRNPLRLALLFPLSSLCWWYFEFLNRVMENWRYDTDLKAAWGYVLHASLCFSTVLPAVFEVRDFLLSTRHFNTRFREGPRMERLLGCDQHALLFALGMGGLYLLATFPDPFFFLTWLAPMFVLYPLVCRAGIKHPLGRLEAGDWTETAALAGAALTCGIFWEMWNFWSFPKWIYQVPYVDVLHVFEMPLLGFAGYLPFGLICALMARVFMREA